MIICLCGFTMSKEQGKVSVWMVAVGSLLGGLGGVAAVVTLVRDFDNPIAKVILDDRQRLSGNRKLTVEAYKAEEVREASSWKFALSQNTPEAFSAYISSFPAGHFVAEAITRRTTLIEDGAWQLAVEANTVAAFNLYLVQYPAGSRAGAARASVQRLSAMETLGKFSIEAVDPTARPAVMSARKLKAMAQEAQREAQRGKSGFLSEYRSESDGIALSHGVFEGRIYKTKVGIFKINWEYAALGIWKFDRSRIDPKSLDAGFWADLVEARGGVVSNPPIPDAKLSGELICFDGRIYQGEFEMDGYTFSPNGFGAIWASNGTLIGSGRWTNGKMER